MSITFEDCPDCGGDGGYADVDGEGEWIECEGCSGEGGMWVGDEETGP